MTRKSDFEKIGMLLVILGGILGLLYGILTIAGMRIGFYNPFEELLTVMGALVYGIIQIVLSLIVLATSGAIKAPSLKLSKNWFVILILGILLLVFAADLPAILIILGAILLALK